MYKIKTRNKRVKRKLDFYVSLRKDVFEKLRRLKVNPRRECGAHPLHGKYKGKWSCWLGSNLRMIYKIEDVEKFIIVENVGNHNIY